MREKENDNFDVNAPEALRRVYQFFPVLETNDPGSFGKIHDDIRLYIE